MNRLTKLVDLIGKTPGFARVNQLTRGIEKESLRVSQAGRISQQAHPKPLGSALTHSCITTDYSEALLEFITSPAHTLSDVSTHLNALHGFTYQHIDNELLWALSMPCGIDTDNEVPIAYYGESNSGKMKRIYREGLGHRYGRKMQVISGIHYNLSFDDAFWQFLIDAQKSTLSLKAYKTQGYFALIRNFRRYFWLLLYLFGASPAVCQSFVSGRDHQLIPMGGNAANSLYAPNATSLRMGDLGYQSSAQEALVLTYNDLNSYTQSLCRAITLTHPDYAALGVRDDRGHYLQLNDSLLQIENEFYSVIRPKRTARSGQTAINALQTGGVEYIEVRCMDLNPYDPLGISEEQMRFLDVFLLFCLLHDSPQSNEKEYRQQQENQHRMVYHGRAPNLTLLQSGQERFMRNWADELFSSLESVAKLLDLAEGGKQFMGTVAKEYKKINASDLTPSAKMLSDIHESRLSFSQWGQTISLQHRDTIVSKDLPAEAIKKLHKLAEQSALDQENIEKTNNETFEAFLKNYYGQYQCRPCRKTIRKDSKTPFQYS